MALSKTFANNNVLTASDVNDHLVNHVPNPSDPFDTGWLPVSITIPTIYPVLVRRVGLTVYFQGIPDGSGLSSGYEQIGTIPLAFRPNRSLYFPVLTNSFNTIHRFRVIGSTGAIEADVGTSPRRFYLDSVSYLVD